MSRSFIETLRRVPLFNELSSDEIVSLAAKAGSERYAAGQLIFSEGDAGGDLLIVKDGSVRVVKTSPGGRQQLISIEREGSSLGEVSVFDGGAYSTSAIALASTELLRLKGAHFRNFCSSRPEVAFKVIRALGHRLRRLRNLVEQLSFATVRHRLIAHLLQLAEERGIPSPAGVEIKLDENNEELAARLGTVRELISRNLGRPHGEGLIHMQRRAVTIPDTSRLRGELSE